MSSDRIERTALSSYRMVFAFGGSLLALALIEPLVEVLGGKSDPQQGWFLSILIFAIIASVFFWLCFGWTKERVRPVNGNDTNLREDMKNLLANRPWWILLGAGIAALIFNSIRDGGAAFYFKYYIGQQSNVDLTLGSTHINLSLTTLYLVLGQAANIIGVMMATPLSARLGKKNTFLLVMSVATVLSLFFYMFTSEHVLWIMIFQLLISICAGCIFPLLWSMYADIADYSEWKNGRRATGLIFSSSSMSQKFGWTIGGAATGWLLGYYGFQANAEQTEVAQSGIRMMLSVLPAIGTVLSVAFIAFYPLTEEKLQHIENELEQKRKNHVKLEI